MMIQNSAQNFVVLFLKGLQDVDTIENVRKEICHHMDVPF